MIRKTAGFPGRRASKCRKAARVALHADNHGKLGRIQYV